MRVISLNLSVVWMRKIDICLVVVKHVTCCISLYLNNGQCTVQLSWFFGLLLTYIVPVVKVSECERNINETVAKSECVINHQKCDSCHIV
jgi:hypothetical protein